LNTEKKVNKLTCEGCKKKIDERYALESGDCYYCLDCWLGKYENHLLFHYDYKPKPIFCKMSFEKNPLFLGIELEVEANDDTDEYYDDEDDDSNSDGYLQDYAYGIMKSYPCYIKYDGSLNNHGMEIVTHPQSVKYHKRIFKWKQLLETLKADGFTSYKNNRCGLHIHISKKWFKPEDFLKFNIFFDKNFSVMKRFSKRTKTNYCNKVNAEETRRISKDKKKAQLEEWYDHYRCVYFGNPTTIELRIFRGTLDIDRFNATLDITEALAYFVKSYSLVFFIKATKKQLWFSFLAFMKQSKKYHKLLKYLEKKTLLYCPLNNIPRQGTILESNVERKDLLTLMGNSNIKEFLKGKELNKLEYYFDDFEDYIINYQNDVYFLRDNCYLPINFEKIVMYNKHYNAQKRKMILDFFIEYGFTFEIQRENINLNIRNRKEFATALGVDIDKIRKEREKKNQLDEKLMKKANKRAGRTRNNNIYGTLEFTRTGRTNSVISIDTKNRDWETEKIHRLITKALAKRENKHYIFIIKNKNN